MAPTRRDAAENTSPGCQSLWLIFSSPEPMVSGGCTFATFAGGAVERRRRLLQATVGLVAVAALLLTDQIVVDHGGRPAGVARAADAATATVGAEGGAGAAATTPVTPTVAGDRTATFAYAGTSDPRQQLTATWRPGRTGRAWVATIHGGSWYKGGPADMQRAVVAFGTQGYSVFNLSYRLVNPTPGVGGVTWTDQRRDILTALRWIRTHAASFGIDPNRGALFGSSAGGNLALAAGLSGDGGNGIRAIVSASGVVQPSALWNPASIRMLRGALPVSARRLAGHARRAAGCPFAPQAPTGCRSVWRAMDVVHAVSPHDPAVMLFQGLADRTVPAQMARTFRTQLDRLDIGGSLMLVPRLGHDLRVALDGGARQAAMLAFVRQRTSVASAPALARLQVTQRSRGARRVVVRVRVRPTPSARVTGRVTLQRQRTVLRTTLSHGSATFTVLRGPGRTTLRYSGSPAVQPRTAAVVIRPRP